ncbi:MAG: VWA domain-containing protein, partial [Asticcacaulis sp.]|nr:VWA domain-containing protein [Asticcacaulis sp.]
QVRLSNSDLITLANNGLSSGGGGNCVVDRSQPNYDVSGDPAVKGKTASLYPVAGCDQPTLQPVKGLSGDIATARSFIKTLQPGGFTNITVGVQWGMEVLSPNQPFAGAVPFGDASAKKFMIVVTDGDNTHSRYSWDAGTIDKRTAAACKDAKARGITVYTVKVIEGNSDMLRKCASQPDFFYDLTNANQLNSTMAGIFKSINKTRLSM